MSRQKLELDRKLIAFFPDDIQTLRDHHPELAYSAIVRNLIHQYAEGLRSGNLKKIKYDPSKIEIT